MKKSVVLLLILVISFGLTVGVYAETSSLELPINTAIVSSTQDDAGYYYVNNATYADYARNPSAHTNEKIRFNGKVVQVIEGSYSSQYRIAVDRNSDHIMYVTFVSSTNDVRVLENDSVTVFATFSGLLTYESTTGASITIPSCRANRIEIAGYSEISTAETNAAGQYIITKDNYDDFARNPSKYHNKAITFSASVEQVIDGSIVTYYRLAIDGDIDCMFYAKLTNYNMTTRLLESDSITVTGLYQGLYTYESIWGQMITIPSCSISKYSLNGNTTAKEISVDEEGYHWITSSNYDEYARNANSHYGEKIRFCGNVIQVIESTYGANTYRIAVDSDYNCIFCVEHVLPQGASRILENDYVFLSGTYNGLYTYSTILGGSVTLPTATAIDISDFHASLNSGVTLGNFKLESVIEDSGASSTKAPTYSVQSQDSQSSDISEKDNNNTSGNGTSENNIEVFSSVVEETPPPVQSRSDEIGDLSKAINNTTSSNSKQENSIEDSGSMPKESTYGTPTPNDEISDHSETNSNGTYNSNSFANVINDSFLSLKEGSSGENVTKMKKRLQELGYFTAGASLSNTYNSTTTERVKLFQKVNGRPQTGIADPLTLVLLFSESAKPNPNPM